MNWNNLLDLIAGSQDIANLIKNSNYWKVARDGARIGPVTSVDLGFDGRAWAKAGFKDNSREHKVQVWDGWPNGVDEIVFDGKPEDNDEVSIKVTTYGINLAVVVKFRFAYEGGSPLWRLDGHFPLVKLFQH